MIKITNSLIRSMYKKPLALLFLFLLSLLSSCSKENDLGNISSNEINVEKINTRVENKGANDIYTNLPPPPPFVRRWTRSGVELQIAARVDKSGNYYYNVYAGQYIDNVRFDYGPTYIFTAIGFFPGITVEYKNKKTGERKITANQRGQSYPFTGKGHKRWASVNNIYLVDEFSSIDWDIIGIKVWIVEGSMGSGPTQPLKPVPKTYYTGVQRFGWGSLLNK